MLVLSRWLNEVVMIGDDIQVKVIAVEGLRVLLGFQAPREMPIHREEVFKRIQNVKQAHNLNHRTNKFNLDQFLYNQPLGGK